MSYLLEHFYFHAVLRVLMQHIALGLKDILNFNYYIGVFHQKLLINCYVKNCIKRKSLGTKGNMRYKN